jgi:hypothetical protein
LDETNRKALDRWSWRGLWDGRGEREFVSKSVHVTPRQRREIEYLRFRFAAIHDRLSTEANGVIDDNASAELPDEHTCQQARARHATLDRTEM